MSTTSHLLRQANHALSVGRLPLAEQLFRKVLRLLPRSAQAHDQLARICVLKKDFLGAASHLQVLCSLNPKSTSHWMRLISCLDLAGDVAQAREAFEQASQYGIAAEALQYLQSTLRLPPEQRQQSLLTHYRQHSDDLTCEIAARLFISDYPDHPLGWQILGAMLHDAGRYEEALKAKQQTVQKFADDANAWNNLAQTQLAMGDAQGALQSAQQALRLEPHHAAAQQCVQQCVQYAQSHA